MQGVALRRVLRFGMALQADAVAGHAQPAGVRIVAVAAGHALRVHAALQERGIGVHLVLLLAVGEEQSPREQRGIVRVQQLAGAGGPVGERGAPGMALAAGVNLAAGSERPAAHRAAARRIHRPGNTLALVERDLEAHVRHAFSQPGALFAQAACAEPGPWQASQDTLISDQAVLKLSLALS